MASLASLKNKILKRLKRDGLASTLQYYGLVLGRHGLHYMTYDYWHDRGERHRTAGVAPIAANEIVASTYDLQGRGYQAFPRLLLLWSIKALDIDPARFSFIDYGSGRGRMLLTAARLPFRRVIGLEFSRRLHQQAVDNIAASKLKLPCHDIQAVNIDAVEYEPPNGNLVAFFYNPFDERVLDRVAERLLAAGAKGKRAAFVIFANSTGMPLFAGRPEFVPVKLRFKDRLRLRLLGTVPIEFFRLEAGRSAKNRRRAEGRQQLPLYLVGASLALVFAPEDDTRRCGVPGATQTAVAHASNDATACRARSRFDQSEFNSGRRDPLSQSSAPSIPSVA